MSYSPIRGGPSARRERGPSAPALPVVASAGDRPRRGVRGARCAFSLLELTLVLAIIAALMGVAAFALLGQGNKAKITASQASLRVLQTAIGQYQLQYSIYPDTLRRLVDAQFVEPRSMEDGWRNPWYYRTPGLGGRPYTLLSGGADRDYGTPADNVDVWMLDVNPQGGP